MCFGQTSPTTNPSSCYINDIMRQQRHAKIYTLYLFLFFVIKPNFKHLTYSCFKTFQINSNVFSKLTVPWFKNRVEKSASTFVNTRHSVYLFRLYFLWLKCRHCIKPSLSHYHIWWRHTATKSTCTTHKFQLVNRFQLDSNICTLRSHFLHCHSLRFVAFICHSTHSYRNQSDETGNPLAYMREW